MPNLSINELSILTGKTRATVTRKLDGMEPVAGPKASKLFPSAAALDRIYYGGQEDGSEIVTQTEATRQLTVARKAQIDLEMEVTAKKRIPLEVAESINEQVHSNVAGIIKAHRDKTLTEDVIHDILTELRRVPESIAQWTKTA